MSSPPSLVPPLPIGMHCAILPFYAALQLCGKSKPLGMEDFCSQPAPSPREIEMASAVSANDPRRAARKALFQLPLNILYINLR